MGFLKSKKSVVALIVLVFWLVYSFSIISTFVKSTQVFYDENLVQQNKNVINHYLNISRHYLMNQNPTPLGEILKEAVFLKEFDFFVLTEKDNVLSYQTPSGKLDDLYLMPFNAIDNTKDDGFIDHENKVIKINHVYDYKLTLGFNKKAQFAAEELLRQKNAILYNLLAVTLLVFLIVSYLLKDILQLSKILGGKKRADLVNIKTLSREAEILLQATKGFEDTSQKLRVDNLLLASSLGPAIRGEMKSGKVPPYTISCTLVRVDLNGYTQLVLQNEPEDLIYILSEYFRNSRDLIERYHGLIYQYVGDEIIFLFKDELASLRAVACVRSLFEMAQKLKTPGLSAGLRLKSSMVSGTLNFVKMDQGHSFSGLPLIETVRMLGQVSEKTENSLIMYSDLLPAVDRLCVASANKTTVFKGFKDVSSLVEIKEFTSATAALQTLRMEQVGFLFRSGDDLTVLLSALTKYLSVNDEISFFALQGSLRDLTVNETDPTVLAQYEALLKLCLQQRLQDLPESRILSSILSLSQNILGQITPNSALAKLLDQCDQARDPRARANLIVAKAFFGLETPFLEENFKSSSHRLAADAVMVAGQLEFNDQLAKKVNEFLHSDQPKFVASGLYLIAALVDYYGTRDLVYLKANSNLRQLAKEIPKYINHSDPMVRIRAQKSMDSIQRGKFLE